jgi:hypothetical protein
MRQELGLKTLPTHSHICCSWATHLASSCASTIEKGPWIRPFIYSQGKTDRCFEGLWLLFAIKMSKWNFSF